MTHAIQQAIDADWLTLNGAVGNSMCLDPGLQLVTPGFSHTPTLRPPPPPIPGEPPASPAPGAPPSAPAEDGLPVWAIVLIVLGVLAWCICCGVGCWYCWPREEDDAQKDTNKPPNRPYRRMSTRSP